MKFLYPVAPTFPITQTFAEHEARRVANGWTNYNGGIDWGIPNGTSIRAAQSGTVTVARSDTDGYGTHVRIETTDGATKYLTIYGHMQSFSVAVGEQVVAGRQIGLSDNTGNSTGPHIHFELRKDGTPIDPFPFLVKTVAELTGGQPGGGNPSVTPGGDTPGDGTQGVGGDMGKEPAQYPQMPKVQVLVQTLNIRSAPGVGNTRVGGLTKNDQVEVIRKVMDGKDIWLQIGFNEYIAMLYGDEVLAKWI
jgi:hypothetical protein